MNHNAMNMILQRKRNIGLRLARFLFGFTQPVDSRRFVCVPLPWTNCGCPLSYSQVRRVSGVGNENA
jgi:hypothetical protein